MEKQMTPKEAKMWRPKTFTTEEKIEAFDNMRKFAMDYVAAIQRNERFKDATHYAYETLMQETLGEDFWDFRNNAEYDHEE